MKAAIFYCIIFCFISSAACCQDEIIISAPPSLWASHQGDQTSGPIMVVLETIFKDLNIKVKAEALPWARSISRIKTGKLDVIPVIFYTEARAEYMIYSVPYTQVPTSVFVPASRSFQFSGLKDLRGKRGLMMRGDSISKKFEAYRGHLNITDIANYNSMLKMLSDYRADYAVAPQFGFLVEAKKIGCMNKIEMLSPPIARREVYLAISKKSRYAHLLPSINKKLEQLQKDGTIGKITETMKQGIYREQERRQ